MGSALARTNARALARTPTLTSQVCSAEEKPARFLAALTHATQEPDAKIIVFVASKRGCAPSPSPLSQDHRLCCLEPRVCTFSLTVSLTFTLALALTLVLATTLTPTALALALALALTLALALIALAAAASTSSRTSSGAASVPSLCTATSRSRSATG